MRKSVFFTILLLTMILAGIVSLYDMKVIRFIESSRSFSLDYVFLSVAFVSNVFIVFFFLTSLFLWREHKRRWILPLWLSSFFAASVSYLLKVFVSRPRPFQTDSVSVLQIAFHFMKDNFNTWNFSFPSFQTVLVFSALPILSREFKKFKYVWLIFAILVGLSRVYFGVHYLSDVLAGVVIGSLIGYIMVFIEEKYGLGSKLIRKLRWSR